MLRKSALLLVFFVILFRTGSLAQTGPDPGESARQRARADIRAALDQVFDGMREADSAKVRPVFAEGARFASLAEGNPSAVVYRSIDGWLEAIDGSGGRWDERLYGVQIEVDGVVASVWAPYRFYLDGVVRHCGVNSIELLRTGAGWKITQLSDTRRTEGCGANGTGREQARGRS